MTLRVLVVDDDAGMRRCLTNLLSLGAGYRVDAAESGRKGIALYDQARGSSDPYHVVLTDLRMPTRDGAEAIHGNGVIKYVKGQPNPATIFLITGEEKGNAEYVSLMNDLNGASPDRIIPKPFEPKDLLALLRAAEANQNVYSK